MKSILFSILLISSTSVSAQVQTGPAKAGTPIQDMSSFETQRDELQAFLSVAERYSQMDALGFTQPCESVNVVIGMAHGLSRTQTEAPDPRVAGLIAYEIADLAAQVRSVVDAAMASECAPAKNNKCCKKAAEADKSDECKDATDKYCKLTGVKIKGCTDNSDDC